MTTMFSGESFSSFDYDDREPQYSFRIPYFGGSLVIVPVSLSFWLCNFLLLGIQSIINIFTGIIVYKFFLQKDYKRSRSSKNSNLVLAYGVLIPFLLGLPFILFHYVFEFKNVALMICFVGAVPVILVLHVTEAIHGMLPSFVQDDFQMLIIYFSACLKVKFDTQTGRPVPFTFSIFKEKLRDFLSSFVQTSLLYSLLLPLDYNVAPRKEIHSLLDLFYWGNLVNSFFMAHRYCIKFVTNKCHRCSLLFCILGFLGGSSGEGLLTSMVTGVTLEDFSDSPLTKSSGPSDFWGNRWDRPVASGLKRGAYCPLRQAGYSRHLAAMATFVISGLIHEYMLWFMAMRKGIPNKPNLVPFTPSAGKHFFCFVCNAIFLLLERALEGHPVIKWMQRNLPKPVRTALGLLLMVLPIVHIFTDEYVKSSFYSDAAFGFPMITYTSTH